MKARAATEQFDLAERSGIRIREPLNQLSGNALGDAIIHVQHQAIRASGVSRTQHFRVAFFKRTRVADGGVEFRVRSQYFCHLSHALSPKA